MTVRGWGSSIMQGGGAIISRMSVIHQTVDKTTEHGGGRGYCMIPQDENQ